MANQVTFQIKIETLGAENVKNVTMDAEELGRVVHEVTDEQEKLNTKLLDINQAQQAIQNICSGFEQLASEVRQYTSVYAQQETAERKLAQVMRNTMAASDAEVRSIRDLCAAQQDLGVIGDEVQLAGAQELATYLEKKSSLEQLIPVMNDMLAQQYGLEASQESAATIATMLGKVMEGQTQALSRYGYSFTEAQEQVLKFGTEEERAAVLAEVVEQSVGGMNAALAQTDSGKAQQVANTIGDLKEVAGQCLARIEPLLQGLSSIGMATQGISGVYRGVMGLTTGILSINVVQRAWNITTVTSTAIIRTLTTVMRGGTVAATTLRVAIRGLMIATGVGVAIAALTFAIEAFTASSDKATKSAEDFANAQSDETAQLQQTRAALEINIAKLKDFHGSKEQEKKIVEEMNNTYGETMGYFSSVAEWYNALIKNSDAYCRQMVIEARTRSLANQIAELQSKRDKEEQFNKVGETLRKNQQTQLKDAPGFMQDMWRQQEETATKAISSIDSQITNLQTKMQESVKELANISFSVKGSPIRPTGDTGGKGGRRYKPTERIDLKSVAGMKVGGISSTIDFTPKIDEKKVVQQLGSLSWKVEMELDQEALKELEAKAEAQRKKFDYATSSVANFGGALAQLGQTIKSPALNIAGTMMQAIATMVQSFAQALLMTSTMGPWAWLAFGATGLAQVTAMVSAVKALPKYADGAMAFGPTLGWFGEYSNAATNPEVVAPLDKLRGMLGTGYGGNRLEVRLKAKGRDLVGVVDREVNLRNRT